VTTKTIKPIHAHEQPDDRKKDTTYYNPQVKEKLLADEELQQRVRGTAGGNKINYPGDVSAQTADMEVVKTLLHSVASDKYLGKPTTEFITLDIRDFYLGADLDRPEYIRISTKCLTEEVMTKHNLHQYVHKGTVLFQIDKCMYGLPQAGLLSQQRLIKHLKAHGYHQDKYVHCLFKHVSNGITFTLVVDDFGAKTPNRAAAEHLIQALQLMYELHIDWEGKKYLGFNIQFDDTQRAVILDMPKYVPRMLELFHPGRTLKGTATPAIYIPPNYGAKQQGATPPDISPTLNAQETHRLQSIVGSVLFYARAIDYTLLPAVNHVSSLQAKPTHNRY
jgi:hypothetical protein